MRMTNKVVVIGVKYDSNLGDLLLGDCLCYLLTKEIPNVKLEYIDMRGRSEVDSFEDNSVSSSNNLYKAIRHAGGKALRFLFPRRFRPNEAVLNAFFRQHFLNASAVVFAGGGIIEYKHYNSDIYIKAITGIANEMNVPVFFNAVGMLDRYDSNSKRARELRAILLNENVKYIGVRENVLWMEEWVDHKKNVELISDPACYASEAYRVNRDKKSKLVGIGLIRPNIFKDFGYDVSECEIADIYASVIGEFISHGYQCELFTNGYKGDLLLADLMISRHPELAFLKKSVKNPTDAKELVSIVSKYFLVFGSRMHSAIVSYSLGIPCGTLCWADKIKAFYDNIGHPERCFFPNLQEPQIFFQTLYESIGEEDDDKRSQFLSKALISIEAIKNYYDGER